MKIRMLSSEELAERWGEIKPYVSVALVHGLGELKPYDLFIECLASTAQCWVVEEGEELVSAAITRLTRYKQYSELVLVTTSGKGWFEYGPPALAHIEDFAKGIGCKYVSIYGRKGWARALPEGYKPPYHIFTKELKDETDV